MAEQWPDAQGAGVALRKSSRRRTETAPPDAAQAAPPGVDRDAALGIYAVTLSPSTTARVSEDGEILDVPRDSRTARADRFGLKSAANRLLPKDHRTTKCMRWRLPNLEIQVLKGAKTDRAFYHGLQVCAMPWTCPVCASKISERRRQEVAHGMKQAEALGLQVFLLTLTVPHGLGDDVSEIVAKMQKAWSRLWIGKAGMALRNALGLFGHIRALEVTHGENGFHPHFHALLFFHPQQTTQISIGICTLIVGLGTKTAAKLAKEIVQALRQLIDFIQGYTPACNLSRRFGSCVIRSLMPQDRLLGQLT